MKTKNQLKQVSRSIRIGNPLHLEACKKGYRITKNRKKYTRKEKHKKQYINL